jgi:hypothetical protein
MFFLPLTLCLFIAGTGYAANSSFSMPDSMSNLSGKSSSVDDMPYAPKAPNNAEPKAPPKPMPQDSRSPFSPVDDKFAPKNSVAPNAPAPPPDAASQQGVPTGPKTYTVYPIKQPSGSNSQNPTPAANTTPAL